VAAEIIPIQLGLTAGNGLTLWAPRWREEGEEWEAFLGHGDKLYVFPTSAHLAAFIRGDDEHDLTDHPEWDAVSAAMTDELLPDDDHRFDIIGVPELVAETPDIWTLAELADTVAILHSLADVCDLPAIDDVLAAADGFALLSAGEPAFSGRRGEKLWAGIGSIVSQRWDEVIDALDGLVSTPELNAEVLAAAEAEAIAVNAVVIGEDEDEEPEEIADLEEGERDPELTFWDEIGVDCIEITIGERSGWTVRCYLEDQPVFLSQANRIQIFSSDEKLENYLSDAGADHQLASLAIWPQIRDAITGGEAVVVAGPENTYLLDGLAENLAAGPAAVDRQQLELAVELLTDAALARNDDETTDALSSATPLASLLSAILKPDADRMAPAPPFDDEVGAWSVLVDRFALTLDWDGEQSE